MWKYCYVFNYNTREILEFELDEEDNIFINSGRESLILHKRSLNADECEWMYTREKINQITNINKK